MTQLFGRYRSPVMIKSDVPFRYTLSNIHVCCPRKTPVTCIRDRGGTARYTSLSRVLSTDAALSR